MERESTADLPREDQAPVDRPASIDPIAQVNEPAPLLVIISGPSGVGKDEIIRGMKAKGFPLHFVVTATTRPRRETEREGIDYHFVSVAEFAELIEKGELLEHAVVYGDHKGIPKQQVRDALASGVDVILRIDVQGAHTMRRLVEGAVFIFLTAESEAELERRLRERKSDPPDRLKMRIATAREELRRAGEFDYVVPNRRGEMDDAVDVIGAIITAEKHRVGRRPVLL